eukprot:scaffold791_cov115-Cylindrotheca_fusiformis.AAC.13
MGPSVAGKKERLADIAIREGIIHNSFTRGTNLDSVIWILAGPRWKYPQTMRAQKLERHGISSHDSFAGKGMAIQIHCPQVQFDIRSSYQRNDKERNEE